jgi:hypothetical protein
MPSYESFPGRIEKAFLAVHQHYPDISPGVDTEMDAWIHGEIDPEAAAYTVTDRWGNAWRFNDEFIPAAGGEWVLAAKEHPYPSDDQQEFSWNFAVFNAYIYKIFTAMRKVKEGHDPNTALDAFVPSLDLLRLPQDNYRTMEVLIQKPGDVPQGVLNDLAALLLGIGVVKLFNAEQLRFGYIRSTPPSIIFIPSVSDAMSGENVPVEPRHVFSNLSGVQTWEFYGELTPSTTYAADVALDIIRAEFSASSPHVAWADKIKDRFIKSGDGRSTASDRLFVRLFESGAEGMGGALRVLWSKIYKAIQHA